MIIISRPISYRIWKTGIYIAWLSGDEGKSKSKAMHPKCRRGDCP
jgi:hypothetical protein